MLISLDTVSVTVLDLRTDITITNIARHFYEAAPWHNISREELFVFRQFSLFGFWDLLAVWDIKRQSSFFIFTPVSVTDLLIFCD